MQIIISHYRFTLRDPYSAGDTLSTTEAAVLNALRAENIRNTIKRKWNREIGILSGEQEEELNALAMRVDEEYQFSMPGAPRTSTMETLCDAIARERAGAELRKKGITMEHSEFEWAVSQMAKREDIREEAREQLRVREQIANASLEDLLP